MRAFAAALPVYGGPGGNTGWSPTLSDVLRLKREHRVDLRHNGGAFTDRRRDAFGRARAHVADREHAREAGLERQRGAAALTPAVGAGEAGEDEALVVHRRAVLEPDGIGVGPDEQEEMAQRVSVRGAGGPLPEHRSREAVGPVAFQRDHLLADVQVDIGEGADAVDEVTRHRRL